ncbi:MULTISPECIES: metal ABC transporter solute-binding protein, Zn/Mn family [Paenibacillus]|uniref:metal ABC transporter solute-binding protein, Zn/Mn family n=1 Tax=Paenibacillus TaxID=44249 RepID=UPI000845C542|nr:MULTISPECIES: zinc ABC transporter substrate-binding protein [Paenibacillus]AOK91768.1 manganese transporter [Paenibacillus polymyxa]MCP3810019.1 zinc ABC transporter substrate-binding protein [Paenibacillus sp. Lou8.1]MDY8046091.1 zinc ABC transporter substrate-binding protein [Paenibacillus polymyxa]
MNKQFKKALPRWVTTVGVLSLALVLATACTDAKKKEQGTARETGQKIKATATIGMISDIVGKVGGNHVEVTGIMKSGVDPHLYKASQGDMRKLDQADVIFYNGLHLEGKMQDILEKISKQKPVIPVSKNIAQDQLRAGSPEMGSEHDPHIWFNVQNWMSAVETVRDELSALDAVHAEEYKANAEAYLTELRELDDYTRKQIASIPEAQRVLVTAHDAFGYFGDAYHIQVRGLQGMSTESEAGSQDVTKLRDYLVEHKIKAIFVESSVPRKAIDAVIQGAAQQGHTIKVGGELYSDAMGEEGTEDGTYIGMVKHNVNTIVKALK